MAQPSQKLTRLAACSVVALVLATMLATWWIGGRGGRPLYWRGRLETASDHDAALILQKVVSAGGWGIDIAVEALGAPREPVALAARDALRLEMDRWELLGPGQAAGHVLAMAEALSAQVDRFDPRAKGAAADFAVRILLWPFEESEVDRVRLVAACDHVLRAKAASQEKRQPGEPGASAAMLEQPRQLDSPSRLDADAPAAPLPAMALPQPDRLGAAADAQIAGTSQAETKITGEISDAEMAIELAGRVEPGEVVGEDLTRLNAFELFERWHAADAEGRLAIDEEARRRHYTVRQIEVARHLASPSVQERRQWIEALPGLSGIDAKPWLLKLSYDDDTLVRMTTVTLMATSSDPVMLRRVAEMARSDADDTVRDQAARTIPDPTQ